MGTVTMWVDLKNFELFVKDKPFTGWNDESTTQVIQIAVIKEKIMFTVIHEDEGIEFSCK
jgi:hypothetical protein